MKATRIHPQPAMQHVKPAPPERRAERIQRPVTPQKPPTPLVGEEDSARFQRLVTTLAYVNSIMQTGITLEELRAKEREHKVVLVRELCTLLMHYIGRVAYPEIKAQFGKSTHATFVAQSDRLVTLWLKSLTQDELANLMERRALHQ